MFISLGLRATKIAKPASAILVGALFAQSLLAHLPNFAFFKNRTEPFVWVGNGGNSNWTTATNWSTAAVPGASDTAIFDSRCGANCNATVDASISIGGIDLKNSYSGTITQYFGSTIAVGSSGWTQAGGTFTGGSNTITLNGNMSLTGGTFTSTSGTLNMNAGTSWTVAAGTFSHHNGSVVVDISSGWATVSLDNGASSFYDLALQTWAGNYNITGTITVARNFQFGSASGSNVAFSGDTIDVKGDVTSLFNGTPGNTIIKISGTGAQTATGTGGAWPSVTINKTSGTLSLSGTISIAGIFTYTTGTIAAGTSTVEFSISNGTTVHSVNGITLANVTFAYPMTNGVLDLNSQSLNLSGTLKFNAVTGNANLDNGTINTTGDVTQIGTWDVAGTVVINITGITNTTINPSGSLKLPGGTVNINKTAGTKVTLTGNTQMDNAGQNPTVTAGTLDMAGYNLTVGNNITNNATIKRGTNPSCGTLSQGGSYSGSGSVICP